MVGKEAEQGGIIRSGAKLVRLKAIVVPKITVVVGNSFGAGNYVMCGKAYDPALSWLGPMQNMLSWEPIKRQHTYFLCKKSPLNGKAK